MPTTEEHKESRIAVLETKADYIIKNMTLHEERDDMRFKEQGYHVQKLSDKMDEISSRLDKQNGTIPHLMEALSQLVSRVDSLTTKIEDVSEKAAITSWRTNLLYAILGGLLTVVGYAAVGAAIHK